MSKKIVLTDNSSLFYGKNDLLGFSYYYYLPKLSPRERKEISEKITNFKGKISVSLKEECIVIIERVEDCKTKEFIEEILHNSSVMLYSRKKVTTEIKDEIYKKCIILQDFLVAISKYETDEKTYKKLVSHGLPQNIRKEALIAILCKYDFKPTTKYHEFPLIKRSDIKNNKSIYDIPMYLDAIPSGFSPFWALDEKRIVAKYITINANNQKGDSTETIKKEPKPFREHTYCHLCKVVYKDHIAHLDTKTHKENMKQNQKIYDGIESTFRRIRDFWKDKKIAEINEIEEERDIVECIPKGHITIITSEGLSQSTAFQSIDSMKFGNVKVAYVKNVTNSLRKKRKSNEIKFPSRAIFHFGETKFFRNYYK